ncbi:MAG TPA: hypothetical protein VF582_06855 [Allosphingosinicella sp.]|jgi:hypothetical protein
MIAALSRAVMALAVSCLGDDRREWALAMEAEFEAAKEDGKPLAFALGCLVAAWRELPAHEEGRFMIASHVLAFVLILPTAALLAGMAADFPVAQGGAHGLLEAIGGREPLLSEANRSAVPALAALAALLAAAHVRIAWLVLERDWERIAAVGALAAAAMVTLVIFSVVVFAYFGFALGQAAALAVELAAISALARWHGRSFGEPQEALEQS